MNEFKGSKGIWEVEINNTEIDIINESDYLFTNSDSTLPYSVDKANAYLMAASPELLEALKNCNRVLATYNSDQAMKAYLIADKAINKALNKNSD